ncbi:PAC2 family protein [Bremerella volcania]|uniref:PAC2 family protein n=1 Tax=Bremerella volcania TaxID=2527984 RepID=A0A518C5W8_9BACT|nr:PAC2 family protein [Bremerella volcania]QDU74618.1 PAC2 family protein [Bremerella volcania]
MPDDLKLNKPWLVAVWPGMGHVAISAGYYLMAKLGMHLLAEFSARELFDVEHVEVKGGLIRTGRLPRSRLFVWMDPQQRHDIIVFIGEAQPPSGKYAFCRRLIEYARELGVERVFTFAAMATQMHPEHDSRVFGAAAEMGLRGACLLGEMPHIFAQLPFPKASLAVLKVFTMIADIEIDTAELSEQAQAMEEKLGEILAEVERAMEQQMPTEEEDSLGFELPEAEGLSPEDERLIERLFEQARRDRSKAYELKRELDRLDVFDGYEDRFLDLFKKPD